MKRICIFGDSITWAMGIPERVGWADLLRNYLEKQSDYYLEIYSLGIDRNTSSDLLKRIKHEAAARKPDLIIIDIGTNDSLQYLKNGKLVSATTKKDFQKNLENIIKIAKEFTDEIILMGLALGNEKLTNPLPRSITGKRYTKKRMAEFNVIIKKVCYKENIAFVDIVRALRNSDFVDGLHPNRSGHKKIFERILDIRKSFFTERNVIVDKNDKIIGAKLRSDITKKDIYRVASLWLYNKKGQLLLAQRAFTKSHDPGKWGPSVAGTVAEGESYLTTIIRETKEELGLSGLKFIKGPKVFRSEEWQFWSQRFYSETNKKASEIKIQKNEIEQVKWFNEKTLPDLIKKNPEIFIPSMKKYYE